MKLKFLVLLCSLNLSACTLFYTDYEEPTFPDVSAYLDYEKFKGQNVGADFYKAFLDDNLTLVINQALVNNYDMQKSYINVQKALLNVDLTATNDHPSLSSSFTSKISSALDRHDSSVKGSNGSFNLSYQLDLFGKLNAQDEASLALYKATAYEYKAMRLSIIQTAASAYWQYAYALEAVKLGKEDLNDSKTRLNLVNQKFVAGAANSLDVDDAHINHLKVQEQLDLRIANLQKAKTALNTILGQTAQKEVRVSLLDETKLPKFNLDIPSKLLSRRPDLMKDAALLEQAYAKYNLAKTSFFPDFTFSAAVNGSDTNTFVNFLNNPIGSLGAAITLPFLNFNELSIKKDIAKKDIEYYNLSFVSDYINAVAEVYDGVSDYTFYQKSYATTKKTYKLSVQNYARYRQRYEAGLVDLSDFLNSADTMRNAKIAYLEAKLNRLKSTMALMSAIGGDNDDSLENLDKSPFRH